MPRPAIAGMRQRRLLPRRLRPPLKSLHFLARARRGGCLVSPARPRPRSTASSGGFIEIADLFALGSFCQNWSRGGPRWGSTEIIRFSSFDLRGRLPERPEFRSPALPAQKYNRSTMENCRQLQCKALKEQRKSRRRKNNGNNEKNNAKNNGDDAIGSAISSGGCGKQ